MRVASVVAPAVVALLAASAAGCSSSSTSRFCSVLTHTKVDFSDALNPSRELAALDQVLAQLPPRDRRLVAPVRDYARVLYRRTNWSPQRQVAFLHHFFRVDVPALDKRLRDECDVPLSKHIAPFSSAGSGA